MKLLKTESPYLSKSQWRKVLMAMSIMTIALYVIAMIFSLCGSNYFILDYQNSQMDKIEAWFRNYDIYALITFTFLTLESSIILSFTLQKLAKWYYVLSFYVVNIPIAFLIKNSFQMAFTISQFVLILSFIFVDNVIVNKKIIWKEIGKSLLRLLIAVSIVFLLQIMIYVIKAGYFSVENHRLHLSGYFIYSLEYDIALSVLLYTITLYINREKGDSDLWVTAQDHGSSSQTSTKQLQKSNTKKNLTKIQRNKLRLLYTKVFLTQTLGFLLLMVLPFLLGKVFEFLVMYLAFAVVRYILGFKYSLHYKKESICITVGVIVFGILTLAVPFFTVNVILAVSLGIALAVLLHLSYKYKGMWLFNKLSKPDKFAHLYVIMDGDLSPHHVKIMCYYRGLDTEQTQIILDFAEGNKKSYIAKKYNYSEKTIERKINEAIDILDKNS